MARAVWKFPLAAADGLPLDEFYLDMPAGAELISVQVQLRRPWLWALVDDDAARERRHFVTAGTGHELPDGRLAHVGSYQMFDGAGVFHVFEADAGAVMPGRRLRPPRPGREAA